MVQIEIGAEEQLQEPDVEQIAVDGVVTRDGVPEPHAVVVHGPVDALLVEEVREVGIEELHQVFQVGAHLLHRLALHSATPPRTHTPCHGTCGRASEMKEGSGGLQGGGRPPEAGGNWTEELVGESCGHSFLSFCG